MGKAGRSKNKAKRSTATLPKGIPHKRGGGYGGGGSGGGPSHQSPFEHAKQINSGTPVKHHVHNGIIPGQQQHQRSTNTHTNNTRANQSSLSKSISLRKSHLSKLLSSQSKNNTFIDRRIGESTLVKNYDGPSLNDVMLKRIVKERVRRSSKRLNKFSLNDDDDNDGGGLTHRVSFIFCLYMHEMLWGEIDHIFFTSIAHTCYTCHLWYQ